ncbi:MAG: polyribonucleotide nucleotidyltransferase, partial [Frankiaceae bacterium]|nr:polyribonucleotide nucleotidyltransferase [Frankiaceae bacterium]
ISKLGRGKRLAKVEDAVNVGDKLQVEILEVDQRGKISLGLVEDAKPAESGGSDAAADAVTAGAPAGSAE